MKARRAASAPPGGGAPAGVVGGEEGDDVPESVREEEEGREELGEDIERATLAARWFLRSGMRPPSDEHQRSVREAAADDVDGEGR